MEVEEVREVIAPASKGAARTNRKLPQTTAYAVCGSFLCRNRPALRSYSPKKFGE